MNLKKTMTAVVATASMFTGGAAMASDVVRPAATLNAKAPEAGVRTNLRTSKRASQVEGGSTGGAAVGTTVIVAGVALVATAAGIWVAVDEEDQPSTP